jgi:hypothetical protein
MIKIKSLTVARGLKNSILAMVITICLLCATTVLALANTVYINDAAHVLGDGSQVRNEAAKLPNPISIYTTSTFNGTKQAFDQQARSHISNANMIVIAIDAKNQHLVIEGGSNVQLTNSQYQDAIQSFVNNYKSGGYINGTVGAIQTLHNYLGSAPVNGNNNYNGGVNVPATSGGGFFSSLFFPLCCVGVLILVIVGALFAFGRRMFGFGRRQLGGGMPTQQPYNQPFNQGYPPNYGGPGNYNQGSGMNPWAAGGLGAAAGGLIGYELGKEQGENQGRDPDWNQGQGGQDDGGFGGGASGDFGGGGDSGGGAGGDFGGGGGGGGDFGGGDFGGGGGGGDF